MFNIDFGKLQEAVGDEATKVIADMMIDALVKSDDPDISADGRIFKARSAIDEQIMYICQYVTLDHSDDIPTCKKEAVAEYLELVLSGLQNCMEQAGISHD